MLGIALAKSGLRVVSLYRASGTDATMTPNASSKRTMARANQAFLVVLIAIFAFGAIRAASDGAVLPAGLMALMALFVAAMLWASQRQFRLGQKDKPALLAFVAVAVLVIVVLAVVSLG